MNTKVTEHLKALLLGGAVLAAAQTASAKVEAQPAKPQSLDARIEKVRAELGKSGQANFRTGNGSSANDADLMWWRNAWGNGGWHNGWGNGGWHNGWGNGGWGNWHNF